MENKKANGFVTVILTLIIIIALTFVFLLYFDIDTSDIQSKVYGKPSYQFNEESSVFLTKTIVNKLNYAYAQLSDNSILCLYGIAKSNGDLLINDVKEPSSGNVCFKDETYLGKLYITKNNQVQVYDINCAIDSELYNELSINETKLSTIMCKENWFGFFTNNSIYRSYDYQIINE